MYTILITVHVITCLLMILVVLLQSGRGAGLMVFGGGGDSLINTPTGSSFMKKFTTYLAAVFGATSLIMTIYSTRMGFSSVTTKVPPMEAAPRPAPAQPAPQPAAQPEKQKPEPAKPPQPQKAPKK
ncbi:MAG: preprotein translocase subunit SecG [Elusimicrobia bacterium]|nr:preprotein translocase subunit SecG [Elusimicrobiota bacterium]